MRLKIVSDGSPYGTRVVNADTGETLDQVVSVEWGHSAGGLPVARLECNCAPVEIVAGQIKRYELTNEPETVILRPLATTEDLAITEPAGHGSPSR